MGRLNRFLVRLESAATWTHRRRALRVPARILGLGILHNVVRRRLFRPYVRDLTVNGGPIRLRISSPIAEQWYGHGIPEGAATRAFLSLLSPGQRVADVGAHHGVYSVLAAKAVGADGKILAMEPHPTNVSVLRENVALNGLENVVVLDAAAGATKGMASFHDATNGRVRPDGSTGTIAVPVVPLDEAKSDVGWDGVDVLKIDVEGFEGEVLAGARVCLESKPRIFLEVHPVFLAARGKRPIDVLAPLGAAGYVLWVGGKGGSDQFVRWTGQEVNGEAVPFIAVPADDAWRPPE